MSHLLRMGCVRPLAVALACLLTLNGALGWAQEPARPKLNIVIVEGDQAINNIRQRTAREPVVQVEDENHRPIAGVAIIFLTPQHGASAVFADGTHSLTVTTDQSGRAVARGFHPTHAAGKYEIRVNASYQNNTASTTIHQENIAGAAGSSTGGLSGKVIALIVVAAAGGVAGGVYAATRGGGQKPISITPGTGTVGRPQ